MLVFRVKSVSLSPSNFPTISAKILAEKRRTDRIDSTFSAAILVDEQFVCHCIVKDISSSGLKLQLEKGNKVPAEFTLKLASLKNPLVVQKQWSHGDYMGVKAIEGSTQGNDFV